MRAFRDTALSYCYTRVLPLVKKHPLARVDLSSGDGAPIAAVCDEMTWQNLRREWPVALLYPRRWRELIEKHPPALFFCEAAWQPPWRGRVYKDKRVLYENRRELLAILDYCKAKNIPTAFWAKEDPAYFEHKIYDFTDTALRYDHVLTTAIECVDRYKALGHESVNLWPFGYSDKLFFPPGVGGSGNIAEREEVAVFAGSWFADHPKRCEDMAALFELVINHGIPLCIYDRHRKSGRSTKPFPRKYRPFVRDAVPYEELGEVYRKAKYVLNVNTVSDSGTMFARRVYEAMACGCTIISNDSRAMRAQFGDNVWYIGESFDFSKANDVEYDDISAVLREHSNGERVKRLWAIVHSSGRP